MGRSVENGARENKNQERGEWKSSLAALLPMFLLAAFDTVLQLTERLEEAMKAGFSSVTMVEMTDIFACGRMVSRTPWRPDCVNLIRSRFLQRLFSWKESNPNPD